jgi:hypothetical protein
MRWYGSRDPTTRTKLFGIEGTGMDLMGVRWVDSSNHKMMERILLL